MTTSRLLISAFFGILALACVGTALIVRLAVDGAHAKEAVERERGG